MLHLRNHLLQRNGLNLNRNVLGEGLDSNTAAGGLHWGGEELLVNGVHAGKVAHVGKEDVDLDNLGEVGASGLEDITEVLENLLLVGF